MSKSIRFMSALWSAKFIRRAMLMVGRNATFLPGELAYKLCPDMLKRFEKPKHIYAVTGTNGKTTSANFLGDFLKSHDIEYIHNNFGSNTLQGVITAFSQFTTCAGKMPYDYGIIEVDERSSIHIYSQMTPDYLLVTNLFRDSYKRNAHVDYIFSILEQSIPQETVLIVNSDDLISSRLCPENRRVTFGIDPLEGEPQVLDNNVVDIENCPECDHPLRKDFVRYNHLGRFTCENCGHTNLPRDYAITSIDQEKGECILSHREEDWRFPLVSKNIVDLYNLVSTVALLHESGFSMEDIRTSFKKIKVIESRFLEERCGDIDVILLMAKAINPIASSRSFDYIRRQTGRIAVILGNSEIKAGGKNEENIGWLYDIDFHFLHQDNIQQFITLGRRHKDFDVRLLLAGVDEEKIISFEDFSPSIAQSIDYQNVDKIFILNDSDNIVEMMQVRDEVARLAREAAHDD